MVTKDFEFEGHRLVYDEYGNGDRVVVLLPGLLFSRKMHAPLAETLADRGYRVLCLDLLGHGESDRPPEMWNYGMLTFGRQAIALLDHAVLGCAIAFTPLLVGLTFGAPVARLVGRGARLVPRGSWLLGDMMLDWLQQDPKPSASVLQGLFYGRVAPPREERAKMTHQTLVIGHYRDPIHPFSDSDMLVRELPNARLVQASSVLELRLTPERLTGEIVEFVERCFQPKSRGAGRRRGGAGPARRGSHRAS